MNNDDPIKKTGKMFWFIAWGFALLLLTLYFDDQLGQQFNPNQQPESQDSGQYRSVTLKRNAMGAYIASGFINNVDAVFLVDTGATSVAVPAHLANRFGLKKGTAHLVRTANGTTTAYATVIEKLSLGKITLYNVDASINPGIESNEILLGMSALKDLEFTQKGKNLTIRDYQ